MAKSSGSPVSRAGCGVKSVCDLVDLHGGACEPTCWPVARVGEQQLAEGALRRAVGLVAGRRGVRQVVGDLVLADLLGEHARGGDVEATVHRPRFIGRRPAILVRSSPVRSTGVDRATRSLLRTQPAGCSPLRARGAVASSRAWRRAGRRAHGVHRRRGRAADGAAARRRWSAGETLRLHRHRGDPGAGRAADGAAGAAPASAPRRRRRRRAGRASERAAGRRRAPGGGRRARGRDAGLTSRAPSGGSTCGSTAGPGGVGRPCGGRGAALDARRRPAPGGCARARRRAPAARPPSRAPRAATRWTCMPERRGGAPPRCATRARAPRRSSPRAAARSPSAILARAREAGVPVREDPALATRAGRARARRRRCPRSSGRGRRGARLGLRSLETQTAEAITPKGVMQGRGPRMADTVLRPAFPAAHRTWEATTRMKSDFHHAQRRASRPRRPSPSGTSTSAPVTCRSATAWS